MTRTLGRLPLWQAGLWVVLGGILAQLAGGLTASVLRVRWGAGDGADARLVVPALVVSSATLMLVALGAARLSGLSLKSALSLRPASAACFAAAALGTVMLGPTADVLMRGMQLLLPKFNLGVVSLLHDLVRDVPVWISFPVFALLPGVAEELTFRGLLQTAAGPGWLGITISALAFAVFHIDPHHVAGVLPLGFFLAWVGARCGTGVTIFAHVVNNAVAIAAVHSEALDVGYGTDEPLPWRWLPASLALVAIAAWIVLRNSTSPAGIIPVSDARDL